MINSDNTLLYKKHYCLTINDIQHSLYYYFDYDERSFDINMPFQHFHSFFEIMILLSPKALHLVEGIPYSIRAGDMVLLRPSVLHRSEYPKGPASKRIIISFLYPPALWEMPDTYQMLFEPFYASLPIFRFPSEQQRLICEKLNRIRNVQYLLLNTTKKISQLAEECGFTSFSQFNRIFQKYCGQSPSQFRKNGSDGGSFQT